MLSKDFIFKLQINVTRRKFEIQKEKKEKRFLDSGFFSASEITGMIYLLSLCLCVMSGWRVQCVVSGRSRLVSKSFNCRQKQK